LVNILPILLVIFKDVVAVSAIVVVVTAAAAIAVDV
jgi:hypothetical protein